MNIQIGSAASRHFKKVRQALVAVTGTLTLLTTAAFAGSGAIYSSTADGTTVNQNLYSSKADVYLNGGPQNESAQGLDDGTYYYQVTDPSGTTLLSSDAASNRQVVVSGGVVAGATGAPSPHANGSLNTANGSIPVQVAPFDDTPNGGGEYKLWLIPITKALINETDSKVLAFSNSDAKTDNFKVLSATPPPVVNSIPVSLSGTKYYDLNANGRRDTGEVGVSGFQIEVTFALSNSGTTVKGTVTDGSGAWSVFAPSAAELAALGTDLSVVGFVACEVQPSQNVDGSFWVQMGPLIGDQTPNAHVIQDNLQDYCWTGSLLNVTSNLTDLNFGNICMHQPSGGFTLGYWSNKNGEGTLKLVDPAWRNLLNAENLKWGSGGEYDVVAYKDFRSWILGATATNMAYMLSAQLAATTLDNAYKGLASGTLLYLPSETAMQPNLAECYGANVVSVGTVISQANADLGLAGHGNTTAAGPVRDHQECLKNILDNINNNKLLFVSPTPCGVVYPQ